MSTQMMHQTIADYFKTQPVMKAWLFGSYSRNEQRPWSDVDILVQYDRSRPIAITVNISLFIPIPLLAGTPCTLAGSVTDPYVQYYSRQILWHS